MIALLTRLVGGLAPSTERWVIVLVYVGVDAGGGVSWSAVACAEQQG
ncbi:hypothetical protein [Blastococcus mobilis]|nr:hypothetical protein [Blastococcus mobilis]